MTEDNWDIRAEAVVERPRNVREHPLLSRIYERHDRLISEYLPEGRILEVAFGQYMHPDADVGLEAWESNVHELNRPGVVGDARWLPFENDSFDGIIGRRFLHHVPEEDRRKILDETSRVTKSGGKVILLEGTPGIYRKLTKGLAFRLGILEEDNDIYGHISGSDLRELVGEELEVIANRSLGSPLMPASILGSDFSEKIFHLYTSTQFIKWWTLVVGEKSDRQHQKR